MLKRIKAIFKKDEADITPQEWFDLQYAKQIRRKHVTTSALLFSAGAMFPAAVAFGLTGDVGGAAVCALASVTAVALAIPELRKIQTWSWIDRRYRNEAETDYVRAREANHQLIYNYNLLCLLIERGNAEEGGDDASSSAEIIPINWRQ
jgi:hypothetical protein